MIGYSTWDLPLGNFGLSSGANCLSANCFLASRECKTSSSQTPGPEISKRATQKNPPTFHYTGLLIGIPILHPLKLNKWFTWSQDGFQSQDLLFPADFQVNHVKLQGCSWFVQPIWLCSLLLPLSFRQAHLPTPQRIQAPWWDSSEDYTSPKCSMLGKNMQPTWRKPKVLVSNLIPTWIFVWISCHEEKSNPTRMSLLCTTHFSCIFWHILHTYPVSALDNFQSMLNVGIPYKCKAHILGNVDRVQRECIYLQLRLCSAG